MANSGVDDHDMSAATLAPHCPSCGVQVGPIAFCARHDVLRPEPARVRRAMATDAGWHRLEQAHQQAGSPEFQMGTTDFVAWANAVLADAAALTRATAQAFARAVGMGTGVRVLASGTAAARPDQGFGPPPTAPRSASLISAQGPPAPPLPPLEVVAT